MTDPFVVDYYKRLYYIKEMCDRAIILAAGLGSRMRKHSDAVTLSARQAAVADTGVKALIPIDRPFLDYVIDAVAEAGIQRICLVIGPGHTELRDCYTDRRSSVVSIDFAVQQSPRGTADALLAAKHWAGRSPFLMLNSDNHYPSAALSKLRRCAGSGLVGFERDALIAGSNIPADRVNKFAAVERAADGRLKRVHEKPSPDVLCRLGSPLLLSMNCWRFGPSIFEACSKIDPSARGEYEITDAVQYAIDQLTESFEVIVSREPVLDLSSRDDIAGVTARLAGRPVTW